VVIQDAPVRRRLVGAALRRYRQELGYGLDDTASILECDRSKISRIETWQRGIRNRELRALLAEYGVDPRTQDVLAMIANPRGARGWSRAFAEVLPDAWLDYLHMEAAAAQILVFDTQQVPGLLQTKDYARAIASGDPRMRAESLPLLVEATMARQRAMHDETRLRLTAVIGEGALRQMVGGADVMREQLLALARLSGGRDGVSVPVLPFASGAHAASGGGSFSILQFAAEPSFRVVHLPGVRGGACLETEEITAAYASAFEQIRVSALSPAESARLLHDLTGVIASVSAII
jgi:hypothetical protein